MLFESTNSLESEKERNFYSKVFAGYYFNELVPGYESRLEDFTNLLRSNKELTFSGSLDKRFRLSQESTHVTFDFHAYLIDKENDRGELADILIADLANKSAVAIEAKFLENWDFEDDIMKASRRFKSLLRDDRISSFVHVLLISQSKLDAVRRKETTKRSNWTKLTSATLKYPLVVVTWEDISKNCKGPEGEIVREFIKQNLSKSKKQFREHTLKVLGSG